MDEITKTNIAQALWLEQYDEAKIPPDILAKIKSEKNSGHSFAKRLSDRFQGLIDLPMSYVASRTDRYIGILADIVLAGERSPQQCYASALLMGPENVQGYAPLSLDPAFTWPAIDAPQWQNQTGWHFFVGNFSDADGKYYSVQLMFWQYSLLPPPMATALGLSDVESQTLELHLAISDAASNQHYRANTVLVAGTTGLFEFAADPFRFTLGKNVIEALGDSENLFPCRLRAQGWDMGKTSDGAIAIDIALQNEKFYFLEGEDGCAPSVDGVGTLYYSASRLRLVPDRESTITIAGKTITLADGDMWFDHQWGTGFMPGGGCEHPVMRAVANLSTPAPGGWDWFMFQFHPDKQVEDGGWVEMTLSALHTNANLAYYGQTGPTSPGVMTASCVGKFIDSANIAHDVTGTMQVTKWLKSETSPNPSVYPSTDTWYPNEYSFTIDAGLPEPFRQFTVKPIVTKSQTGFFGNGLQYTEGGGIVLDSSEAEIGRCFCEGTNYANSSANILTLAGLPGAATSLLKPPKVGIFLYLASLVYTVLHLSTLKQILGQAKGLGSAKK
ncbi:hypothetical protein BH10PSE14_BH10PSE14_39390 [soil metagenome]